MDKKIKLLMLGTHDSNNAGHLGYTYQHLPSYYDAFYVTLLSPEKRDNSFFQAGTIKYTLFEKLRSLYLRIYYIINGFWNAKLDPEHKEYCYLSNDIKPFSAKQILKKCPKGFVPDLISIHWSKDFITSKVVKDLYELTHARIMYCFADQAPMTGGCHYAVDCEGFLSGCHNCPALSKGKKLSQLQLREKNNNLLGIPMIIAGAPSDMRLAKQTQIFRNADVAYAISQPDLYPVEKKLARETIGIKDDGFYIFLGVASFDEVRKGVRYSIDGILRAAKNREINLIIAGKNTKEVVDKFGSQIRIIDLGFLDYKSLHTALCASDCFISTSLADSGPMMINFAVGLGVPVISFNVGIAQDLVIHKKTGYIADYKNVEDIASGITYLYELDNKDRIQMSIDAKRIFLEKTSIGDIFEQVAKLI